MNTISRQSEAEVVAYLNDLLTKRAEAYFRAQESKARLGPTFLRCNVFYAKVLFDVVFSTPPTLAQFENMGFQGKEEAFYQTAISYYQKWKRLGTFSAIFAYCEAANRLLNKLADRNGFEKTEHFPDIRKDIVEIDTKLKEIRARNK